MPPLRLTTLERKHHEDVLSLLYSGHLVHSHLDWYKAGRWLEEERILTRLIWQEDALMGFIGLSIPYHHSAWVRLVALGPGVDVSAALGALWHSLSDELTRLGVRLVAVLAVNRWLVDYLPELGFAYHEEVVTLHRVNAVLPELRPHSISIRHAYPEDLEAIVAVDNAAFTPPWQMSYAELWQAMRLASNSTLATMNDAIVGYQISTRQLTSGHLARLAIHPSAQGMGVGTVLLDHLIQTFSQRGVRVITVNTQESNVRSQRLYQRFGFVRNGFDLPIWFYAHPAPGAIAE